MSFLIVAILSMKALLFVVIGFLPKQLRDFGSLVYNYKSFSSEDSRYSTSKLALFLLLLRIGLLAIKTCCVQRV